MNYIGIDPGSRGGVAVLNDDDGIAALYSFFKLTPHEIWKIFKTYSVGPAHAVIEKVNGFPGMSVVSVSTFMENYGILQGLMTALGIPFDRVPPLTWKREMGLTRKSGKTNRKERKQLSMNLAKKFFPYREGITDDTAEALLLAVYCRNVFKD